MKIIKATDYGFRKVIRVLLNDTDPQWVHEDEKGKQTPAPVGHTGNTDEGKEACSECLNNWKVFEAQFDRDVLKRLSDPEDPESELVNKMDSEIITEALAMAEASLPQTPRKMVVGQG